MYPWLFGLNYYKCCHSVSMGTILVTADLPVFCRVQ